MAKKCARTFSIVEKGKKSIRGVGHLLCLMLYSCRSVCIKAASSVRWRGAPPHGRGPAIEGKAAQQLSAVRRHGLSIGRARLQLGRTRSRRRAAAAPTSATSAPIQRWFGVARKRRLMGLRWPVAAVVWAALACRSAATGGPTGQCEFSLVPGYIVGPSSYKNVPGCASAAACCDLCAADSPCRAFTYELSRHECFLKNGTEGRHSGSKGTVSGAPAPPPLVTPVITLQHGPISRIDPHYKSWNIDASSNRQWDTRNLSAPLLHYLAGASEPGLLRFGGSGNDGLRYGVGRPCPVGAASGAGSGRCLNESHFSRLMEFAEAAGSRIVFGINIRTHDSQGRWDPTEFSSLLQWAIAKGWGSVFWGFELGNGKL
jgi:hypothetical protein